MSDSESSHQSQRGYNADGVWYQSMPEHVRQETRNAEAAARELEAAGISLGRLQSELLAIRSLVYNVRVRSVVLEDVLQLCHACEAATEASISTRDVLSGLARAAERKRARDTRRDPS